MSTLINYFIAQLTIDIGKPVICGIGGMTIWKSGHRFMRRLVFLLLVLGSFTHLASSQSDSKTATPSSPQPSDAQDNRGSVLTPILSGNIPVAVIFPAPPTPPPKTPVEARPFFDHFSWQSLYRLELASGQDRARHAQSTG